MEHFARYITLTATTLIIVVLGMSFAPCVLGQGSAPGTIIGATSMIDDAPGKSKAGSELERSKLKTPPTPQAQTSTDRVKLAVQMAQDLMGAMKFPESLVTLAELDSVADKTASDIYLIERTRVAVASLTGDQILLNRSIEAVIASGQAPATERTEFCELLVRNYFNQKNFPKAIAWSTRYFSEGGTDADIRRALVLSYYLNNDYARATQEVSADIQAEERAGIRPSEEQLRVLVSSAQKLDDKAAYATALEKYAAYYPKKK